MPNPGDRHQLGRILVDHGALSHEQLRTALAAPRSGGTERLGSVVTRLGMATEDDIAAALSAQLGYPRLDRLVPDPRAVAMLDRDVAVEKGVLPLAVRGDELDVAMEDPTDLPLLDELRLRTGMRRVRPAVATPTELAAALDRAYGGQHTESLVAELSSEPEAPLPTDDDDDVDGSSPPIVRLATQLLADAVRMRASDVHVEATRDGVRVRMRVDGILTEVARVPRTARAGLVSRLKIMGRMDIAERRLPQDGRTAVRIDGEDVDLRMSVMPTMHGETVVMRLLHRGRDAFDLDGLDLEPDVEAVYRRALDQPQGLVLVTGPTGSGKTSTLYAGLTQLATVERNVITLEDPIEYELPGVNQTQMHPRIGLGFATGMRSVLRQDPDVVMVGEIRDAETAVLAVEAAMTGHLVLSTLHTNDALGTIARLEELGVDRRTLAPSLHLVVSQRLVRRLCERCARPGTAPPDVLARLGAVPDDLRGEVVRVPVGCTACLDTGYRGRVVVTEMVPFGGVRRDELASGMPEGDLRRRARAGGARSLREDGLRLALAGATSLAEVARVTPDDPDAGGSELVRRVLAARHTVWDSPWTASSTSSP